jgi:hypothetical protein
MTGTKPNNSAETEPNGETEIPSDLAESTTEAEQEILAEVAKRKGWEWVKGNKVHILNQARLMGNLPDKSTEE